MPRKSRKEIIADLMGTVQKSGHTDSKEFREVLFALNTVNSLGKKKVMVTTKTMQKLGPDELSKLTVADRDEVGFREFADAQQALIRACDEYLGVKKVRFSLSGHRRAKAVKALRDMASQESYRDADIVKLEREGKTWDAVHATARTVVKDASELDKAASAGAGTSTRAVLSDGYYTAKQFAVDTDDEEKIPYIMDFSHYPGSPEKSDSESLAIAEKYRAALLAYCEVFPFNMQVEKANRSEMIATALHCLKKQGLTADDKNAAFIFAKAKEWGKMHTALNKQQEAGIAMGSNMSSRSIATSRMAALLGMDSLVAKTVPVEFRRGNTVTQSGILMETVSGMDINRSDTIAEAVCGSTSLDANGYEFAKQSTALHIMDIICGQVDRHQGNVLFQSHNDPTTGALVIDGIKAIDHDLAFGTNLLPVSVLDIRIVDKQTKEAVEAITPEMVDYMFKDVLEAPAVEALKKRLDAVKVQLSKVPVFASAADYQRIPSLNHDIIAAKYRTAISGACEAALLAQKAFTDYSSLDYTKSLGKGPLGENDPDRKKLCDVLGTFEIHDDFKKSPWTYADLFKLHAAYGIHMRHLAMGDETLPGKLMENPSPEDKAILLASEKELSQIAGDKQKAEEYLLKATAAFKQFAGSFITDTRFMEDLTINNPDFAKKALGMYAEDKAKAFEEAAKAKESEKAEPEKKEPEKTEAKKAPEEKAEPEKKEPEKTEAEKAPEEKAARPADAEPMDLDELIDEEKAVKIAESLAKMETKSLEKRGKNRFDLDLDEPVTKKTQPVKKKPKLDLDLDKPISGPMV